MGSCLGIIGNHNLEFKSGKQTIDEFSKKLAIEVLDGNYKTLNNYPKTDKIMDIVYFVPFEVLDSNFERYKDVKIMSNYIHCSEFQICKNTVLINGGVRYKYWKDVVLEDLHETEWKKQYEFAKIRWNNLIQYISILIKAIGGDSLVFYEDDRFQKSRDLCYEGKSIEEVTNEMTLQWEPTKFENIVENKNVHKVRYGWYYKTLKDDI